MGPFDNSTFDRYKTCICLPRQFIGPGAVAPKRRRLLRRPLAGPPPVGAGERARVKVRSAAVLHRCDGG